MRRVLAALAVAAVLAPAALAHGPTTTKSGYVSTVAGLRPNVVGVTATILGSDQQLQVTNYSGKTVEVLDARHRPMYRFATKGIYQKLGGRWVRIAAGSSYAWHDSRIRWTRSKPPRVVQDEPGAEHRILSWRVPARADGEPFAIEGFLGYRPALGSDGDGVPAWEIALFVVVGLALVGAGARRLVRRRAP
jgi:hypothetical protein